MTFATPKTIQTKKATRCPHCDLRETDLVKLAIHLRDRHLVKTLSASPKR